MRSRRGSGLQRLRPSKRCSPDSRSPLLSGPVRSLPARRIVPDNSRHENRDGEERCRASGHCGICSNDIAGRRSGVRDFLSGGLVVPAGQSRRPNRVGEAHRNRGAAGFLADRRGRVDDRIRGPVPYRFSGVSAGRGALGGGEILDSISRIRALVHDLCLDGSPAGLSSFLNRFSRAPGLSTRLSGATETGFRRRVGRDGRCAFQIPASGQGSRRRWWSVRSAA